MFSLLFGCNSESLRVFFYKPLIYNIYMVTCWSSSSAMEHYRALICYWSTELRRLTKVICTVGHAWKSSAIFPSQLPSPTNSSDALETQNRLQRAFFFVLWGLWCSLKGMKCREVIFSSSLRHGCSRSRCNNSQGQSHPQGWNASPRVCLKCLHSRGCLRLLICTAVCTVVPGFVWWMQMLLYCSFLKHIFTYFYIFLHIFSLFLYFCWET